VSRADAEQMVMSARLKAGWITEDDLAAEGEQVEEGAGA
jgi:N utilization substance protein A